jgi:hypothetical protein
LCCVRLNKCDLFNSKHDGMASIMIAIKITITNTSLTDIRQVSVQANMEIFVFIIQFKFLKRTL